MTFLIKNNFRFSTLNRGFISKKGNYLNFNNTIETPTSSNNGFMRNILTLKKYYNKNNHIFSAQAKFGNIISLNNNDIFSWLILLIEIFSKLEISIRAGFNISTG